MGSLENARLNFILKGIGENMGRVFNAVASITAAMVSRSNRKKTLKNIRKINNANRNLSIAGRVSVDSIIPANYQIGNICVSGGDPDTRRLLVVQNVLQSCSVGLPTVILHEGDYHLEHDLSIACANHCFFRIINASNPYYDPIYRLTDEDAARLIVEASLNEHKIDTSGILYLRALTMLLRKKGVNPYMRMIASCPHNSVQNVILQEEQAGIITPDEATSIRNDITAGMNARPSIEYFFSCIQSEADTIAWKSNLSRSTSIAECIRRGGVLTIDIGSTNKESQLSLIIAELERCISLGTPCRLIVDARSIAGSKKMIELLKKSSATLAWTLSTPDIGRLSGTTREDLATWLALSHKTILFSHSVHTAEQLSAELGDYEHIEVTQSHSGNNNIGQFGFHFGATNNVSTTNKRERVIKPEEILNLRTCEFFMLDNNTASLVKGVVG